MTAQIPDALIRTVQVGAMSFSIQEMGEGPTVLCLHGFPDSAYTWRLLLPALASAGYRAIALTSRGYEPASQPEGNDYSVPALAGDVPALLDALEIPKCHLVGHDWGASIAFAVAAGYPERLSSLTALAVPHPAAFALTAAKDFGQLLRSWYIYYFQIKGRPEKVIRRRNFAFLERLWRNWSPYWTIPEADLTAMKTTFSQPGVLNAALEYYRQAYDSKHPRAQETLHLYSTVISAPTLGLTGATDGCISSEVFERSMPLALFTGGLKRQRIEGAGHFLHLEAPDVVNSAIISHLQSVDGRHRKR